MDSMLFNPEALTAVRDARLQTKSKLAVGAQITVSYVSELEKGNRLNPSADVIRKLADALDCDPAAFFVRRKWLREFVRANPGIVLGWLQGDDEELAVPA